MDKQGEDDTWDAFTLAGRVKQKGSFQVRRGRLGVLRRGCEKERDAGNGRLSCDKQGRWRLESGFTFGIGCLAESVQSAVACRALPIVPRAAWTRTGLEVTAA